MRINPDLKGLIRFLKNVRTGKIHQSEKQLRWNMAQGVAGLVRRKYRTYESEPSPTERMAIESGKDQGAVRGPRQPRSPINIFALLAASVIARKEGADQYLVEIDRGATHPDASTHRPGGNSYPGGIPLGLMAYWIEYPKPYSFKITLRQLGYLHAVREGRAGPGRNKTGRHIDPNKATAYTYVFAPPQRPVWQAVVKELGRLSGRLYAEPLARLMQKEGKGYGLEPTSGLRFEF